MINKNAFNLDKKTKKRIAQLQKQGYKNPVEKAQFEKLSIKELKIILYIANKVKGRRLQNKTPLISTNPIKIKSFKDSYKVAENLVNTALKEKSLGTGLLGEGVLIASYTQIPLEKLEIQIIELNKEIKRKKELERQYLNVGNVDKLVNTAIPNNPKRE